MEHFVAAKPGEGLIPIGCMQVAYVAVALKLALAEPFSEPGSPTRACCVINPELGSQLIGQR